MVCCKSLFDVGHLYNAKMQAVKLNVVTNTSGSYEMALLYMRDMGKSDTIAKTLLPAGVILTAFKQPHT